MFLRFGHFKYFVANNSKKKRRRKKFYRIISACQNTRSSMKFYFIEENCVVFLKLENSPSFFFFLLQKWEAKYMTAIPLPLYWQLSIIFFLSKFSTGGNLSRTENHTAAKLRAYSKNQTATAAIAACWNIFRSFVWYWIT